MFSRFRPDLPEKVGIVNHGLGFPEKAGFLGLCMQRELAARPPAFSV
jgi:hypothetical protein